MKTFHLKLILILLLATIISTVWAQNKSTSPAREAKPIIVTGSRFTYPLVQYWIDVYNQSNPSVQIIIESRGTSDPASYDILIDAFEHDEEIKKNRDYINIARYPILTVANSKSAFARHYADKGLNRDLINQLFFDDLYADKDKLAKIVGSYAVYTRLQKSGPPIVFTHYFGHEQKDIKGKSIAGADEHLLKALLRDSLGVSYLPLISVYDRSTHLPITGLTVLPVDLNGNGKISADEKIYATSNTVLETLESRDVKDINNVPIGTLHLSVSKTENRKEITDFLQWILVNGQQDILPYGFLHLEPGRIEKEKATFARRNASF